MANKKKYTEAQKKAYYSGMGYRAAKEGKAIPFKSAKNKESFKQGYTKAKDTVSKYPDAKGGSNNGK